MIQEGLKTSNYREISKWNEVIEGGIDAQILIVGSSRALVHFDCEYIQKATGKTCYNLGFDGTTFPLQKLMLELYLSGNTVPENIIWSLDYHMFSEAPDYYGFEQLVPYQENPYVSKMLSLHQTPDYQFEIPVFRYSYNPKMKLIGLYSFLGKYQRDPILKYGYRKQDKKWDGTFEEFKQNNPNGHSVNFEPRIFDQFLNFSEKLKKKSVVAWVISPYYFDAKKMIVNHKELELNFKQEALNLGIQFIDLSSTAISNSTENFYNGTHLSTRGVREFMSALFFEGSNLFSKE